MYFFLWISHFSHFTNFNCTIFFINDTNDTFLLYVSAGNNISGVVSENIDSWVKLDGGSEDLDEEMDEILVPPGYMPLPTPQYMNHKRSKTAVSTAPTYALPLHSLAAFSLFLSIPLYTEAVLQDRRRAQMLLRLALGVADDGHGGISTALVLYLSFISILLSLKLDYVYQILMNLQATFSTHRMLLYSPSCRSCSCSRCWTIIHCGRRKARCCASKLSIWACCSCCWPV